MRTTFMQVRDVLEHIKHVQFQAAECCTQMHRSDDDRVGLLIDYFRQWEVRIARCLEATETGAIDNQRQRALLDTWVQVAGTDNVDRALEEVRRIQVDDPDDPDELISKSLALQEEILTFLEQLAGSLPARDVRGPLLSLAAFERKAAQELSTAVLTQRDA
jgi:hypothetical protein